VELRRGFKKGSEEENWRDTQTNNKKDRMSCSTSGRRSIEKK